MGLKLVAVAALVGVPFAANADLISNGSFQTLTGGFSGGNFVCGTTGNPYGTCSATGWTGDYQLGQGAGNVNGGSFGIPTPEPVGSNALILQKAQSASQTFTATTPGEYELSFYVANRGYFSSAPQTVEVLMDGNAVTGGTFSSLPQSWTPETLFFSVTAASHSLTLAGLGDGSLDVTAFVNDVSLTEVSAVPVPASAWLMLSGLGGLGAMARKKRNA